MGLLCEHAWHVLMGDPLRAWCASSTDDPHTPLNLPPAAIGVPSDMALSALLPQYGRQGKPHDRFVVVQGPPFVMGWAAKPGAKPSQTGLLPEGHSCLAALCGGPFELPSRPHDWAAPLMVDVRSGTAVGWSSNWWCEGTAESAKGRRG